MEELTAFVREVVIPGGPDAIPSINAAACCYHLRHGRSRIHRWGIFADEAIPARRRVIEYTGARIGLREVRRRNMRTHIFLFWVGKKRAIDGAIGGSGAEYINHSCAPNLVARLRKGRVTLVSLRRIEKGEELLLDYMITGGAPMMECRCGAPTCRGFMNRPPK